MGQRQMAKWVNPTRKSTAVLSIELGVEDYQTGEDRRVLSAMRNLYAGVLLLCKQVLWNVSPADTQGSLIYKDLVPRRINGEVGKLVEIKRLV